MKTTTSDHGQPRQWVLHGQAATHCGFDAPPVRGAYRERRHDLGARGGYGCRWPRHVAGIGGPALVLVRFQAVRDTPATKKRQPQAPRTLLVTKAETVGLANGSAKAAKPESGYATASSARSAATRTRSGRQTSALATRILALSSCMAHATASPTRLHQATMATVATWSSDF